MLYRPEANQFVFDVVIRRIFDELERRNWDVPGIKVTFSRRGTGDEYGLQVSQIRGADFLISFGYFGDRVQTIGTPFSREFPGGSDPMYVTDEGARVRKRTYSIGATRVVIPKKDLVVFNGEKRPMLSVYTGTTYEQDRTWFLDRFTKDFCRKAEEVGQRYVVYTGGCKCDAPSYRGRSRNRIAPSMFEEECDWDLHYHSDSLYKGFAFDYARHKVRYSPLFIRTNHFLGRGASLPPNSGPTTLLVEEVMDEFKQYLTEVVLTHILTQPLPESVVDISQPKVIPFPEAIGPLYCPVEGEWLDRIVKGLEDPSNLEPAQRYALSDMVASHGNYVTLDSFGMFGDNGRNFIWCGVGQIESTYKTTLEQRTLPGRFPRPTHERYLIQIRPNRANDVYIMDQGIYVHWKMVMWHQQQGKKLSSEQRSWCNQARLSTIVPITEYKGGVQAAHCVVSKTDRS